MSRSFALLALLLWVLPAGLASAGEPWKVGVLIFRETDATATLDGATVHVQATMQESPAQNEVEELKVAAREFARRVVDWSDGLVEIWVDDPVVVSDPLTSVTLSGGGPTAGDNNDTVWVTPVDADPELTALLTSRDYDAVVVFWHPGSGSDFRQRFRTFGGETDYTMHAGKRIIYSALPLNGGVLSEAVRGEAVVHEWLHGIDIHYAAKGYVGHSGSRLLPDSALVYGYEADPNGSFEKFYRDILRGRVRHQPDGSDYFGASAAVWSTGTIFAPLAGAPLPAQLVAPLEGACAGETPTFRWRGPAGPGTSWEITIDSDDGLPGFPHTESVNARSWTPNPGLLVPGARYRWRVSSVEGGVFSAEPDELNFLASGTPATPLIWPSSGPISSEGVRVRIAAATPEVEIRYTLDGSTPSSASTLMTAEGVQVFPPAEVRAIATRDVCGLTSGVAVASYTSASPRIVTNANDAGAGSLRQAILDANATPGREVVEFAIPGPAPHPIALASGLPAITDPLFIDGRTQPDFAGTPVIELYGGVAGVVDGLGIVAGNSMVASLSITRFGGYGISLIQNGGNEIIGCWVGVAPSGVAAGNSGVGIYVNTPNNQIGGQAPQGNLISGNGTWGVELDGVNAFENALEGNFIGTNAAGTTRISNGFGGVLVDNAAQNRIGGADAYMANLISGNGFTGNSGDGIALANAGAMSNVIQGNRIGTNAAGTGDLGNSRFGVNITVTSTGASASNNLIGGLEPGEGNVISGNDATGIAMLSNNGAGGGDNRVQGNFIGTDTTGAFALGNAGNGISISRITPAGPTPSFNLVGGRVTGARNVISGNAGDGVAVVGGSPGGNVIQGNYIGTDATGVFPISNGRSGVRLTTVAVFNDGATNNLVGGTSHGAGNVIAGNVENGVAIIGNATGASGNKIQGNRIGVSSTLGSNPGNGPDGVLVTTALFGGSAPANLIGGSTLGAANVIGGHSGAGVRIDGPGATANVVQGNYVGTDGNGGAHPNGGPGVQLNGPGNAVGGGSAAANVIAGNGGAGVLVTSGAGNLVLTNSISANGALGIDLTGGNPGAIAPVLTSAVPSNGTIVRGTLSGPPLTEYTIELFSSPTCDPSGSGEGAKFLGSGPLTTNAMGLGDVVAIVTDTVALGHVVTATATDELGASTSEFSNCTATIVCPLPSDCDGDGFGAGDNCPAMPALDQSDVAGVGSAMPDGNGDACQCGDVDDDGGVDADDTGLYRAHLANPGALPLVGSAALKCSVAGPDPAICNLLDVVVIRRALAGGAPGVAQVCEAATL